jgi:hypothetical protein
MVTGEGLGGDELEEVRRRLAGARVAGPLGNPIHSGANQVFMVFWLVLLWFRAEKPVWRRCCALGIEVSVAALWAAGSHGPLLGLVAGGAIASAIWAIAAGGHRLVVLEGASLACTAGGYAIFAWFLVSLPSLEEFWKHNAALEHISAP